MESRIIHLELSPEATEAIEHVKGLVHPAYEEGLYDDKAPHDCLFVATCAMLVAVDHHYHRCSVAEEIREAYDNSHCLALCSLNVLNPGCIPMQVVVLDDRDTHVIPGDING